MKYFVIFLFLIGFAVSAYALDDKISHPTYVDLVEYYEVTIVGIKDEYTTNEEYSFYFVISGHGYACANYDVTYPDENGNTISMGTEVLCAPEQHMTDFEINYLEIKGTLGNVAIKKPGIYNITATFEKPSKYFPTTMSKEFRVVESITEKFMVHSPLKQFHSGIVADKIQCKQNLMLVQKYDYTPACVTESTKRKLIERGWTNFTPIKPELEKSGTYDLEKNGIEFDIKYHIKGGSDIKEIILDANSAKITILLEPYDSGSLEITLSRNLIDAKMSKDVDDLFFVLIDGEEVSYDETTNEISRTLTIQFGQDSKIIEVIGTMPL